MYQMDSNKKLSLLHVLLGAVVVLMLIQVYFLVNPKPVPVIQGLTDAQQDVLDENRALLKKVSKLTDVETDENAIVATVTDADGLRKSNPFNAVVYKNATDGDRVLGLSDRMIIFNEERGEIVYDGESPAQLQAQQYEAEIVPIMQRISQLTGLSADLRPQLSTIVDPDKLRAFKADLYKDAQKGDKLVVFSDRVIIYRPSNKSIIFDGKINVNQ